LQSGIAIGTVPVDGSRTDYSADGVPQGVYYLKVHAENSAGESRASDEIVVPVGVVVRPGAPRALSAQVSGSTVTLSWLAPATGGSVASYVLEAGSVSGASNYARQSIGGATTFSASHVPQGRYYVRVRAQNAGGDGPPSNEATVVVGTPLPAPGPPQAFAHSVQGNQVTLTWTAGPGGPPSIYIIEAGTAPGLTNLAVRESPSDTFIASGVLPGTYYVRIRARNSAGESGPSEERVIVVR
jgi:predicted phage tail protein